MMFVKAARSTSILALRGEEREQERHGGNC